MNGRSGAWFRGVESRHRGRIRSGGVEKDVVFAVDTDPALNDRIDDAYRSKYRGFAASSVSGVVNPESRLATIRRVPR